jgi:hypothetical protein
MAYINVLNLAMEINTGCIIEFLSARTILAVGILAVGIDTRYKILLVQIKGPTKGHIHIIKHKVIA